MLDLFTGEALLEVNKSILLAFSKYVIFPAKIFCGILSQQEISS